MPISVRPLPSPRSTNWSSSGRKIELELSDEAVSLIVEAGWDPTYGARPLKRAIQRLVENPLALELLEGRLAEGDIVRAVVEGDEIRFETVPSATPAAA